jgi:hypothetical protein
VKWVFLCLSLFACSGDSNNPSDASPETGVIHFDASVDAAPEAEAAAPKIDAGFPGPHPAVPQVQSFGGAVLTAPNVVPIFYASDPLQSDVEKMLAATVGSSYWKATTSEYGVGPITLDKSIVLTDTPLTTTTSTDIETLLKNYLDGTHPEFPAVALNNIYVLFEPSGTTISDTFVGTSCIDYGGYHSNAKTATNQQFVYAMLPRCAQFGYLSGLDALTGPISHELIEAATDPLGTGFAQTDLDHIVWSIRPLGEVGDMCAYEPQSYARILGSYVVQRTWSNAAALAGHDPCVPPLAGAYYWNAAPVLKDTVTLDYFGQTVSTKGVSLPLNTTKTIDVELFSDGPVADWNVSAVDTTYGTNQAKELDFTWDVTKGNNGDVLHLTITRVAKGQYNGTEFWVYAQRSSTQWNMWFGFASN